MFVFIEIKKNDFSSNIEKIKSNLISSENLGATKILISSEGNKKNILFLPDIIKTVLLVNTLTLKYKIKLSIEVK